MFPQPKSCGLIEASGWAFRRLRWPRFRSQRAAASLKHLVQQLTQPVEFRFRSQRAAASLKPAVDLVASFASIRVSAAKELRPH